MNMDSTAPEQPTQDDLPRLVAELEELVENGKRWPIFKGVFIDEQAFFIGTAKLKKVMPYELRKAERIARDRARAGVSSNKLGSDTIRLIDELEQLVENGRYHVFDKVFIDEQAFFMLTAKLKEALPRDLENARNMLGREYASTEQPAPSTEKAVLDAAQVEAQRIIEEARREAERIVQEARRRGGADFPLTPFGETGAPLDATKGPFGGPEQK